MEVPKPSYAGLVSDISNIETLTTALRNSLEKQESAYEWSCKIPGNLAKSLQQSLQDAACTHICEILERQHALPPLHPNKGHDFSLETVIINLAQQQQLRLKLRTTNNKIGENLTTHLTSFEHNNTAYYFWPTGPRARQSPREHHALLHGFPEDVDCNLLLAISKIPDNKLPIQKATRVLHNKGRTVTHMVNLTLTGPPPRNMTEATEQLTIPGIIKMKVTYPRYRYLKKQPPNSESESDTQSQHGDDMPSDSSKPEPSNNNSAEDNMPTTTEAAEEEATEVDTSDTTNQYTDTENGDTDGENTNNTADEDGTQTAPSDEFAEPPEDTWTDASDTEVDFEAEPKTDNSVTPAQARNHSAKRPASEALTPFAVTGKELRLSHTPSGNAGDIEDITTADQETENNSSESWEMIDDDGSDDGGWITPANKKKTRSVERITLVADTLNVPGVFENRRVYYRSDDTERQFPLTRNWEPYCYLPRAHIISIGADGSKPYNRAEEPYPDHFLVNPNTQAATWPPQRYVYRY